ncbi:hypothetical protein DY000_02020080 [Brassica cretica]|uniref:3'-5' exonuclease domain-containing protein n=1 Tax=Brassica cretica TaxID=69181 RepID=A0ABQ7EMA9_BRACR|nr:hypothetical protein DY000_02020080 [Brassica cretica]
MAKVAGGAVLGIDLEMVPLAGLADLGRDLWAGARYKGVGRVDGELGKATSQLDQLERSSKPQVKWFSSTSWASSVSWEHTQLVRREGGRLDSTLKGMNSLEDGCSIETGFMEVPWKERARRSMDATDEVTGGDCRPLDIVCLAGSEEPSMALVWQLSPDLLLPDGFMAI